MTALAPQPHPTLVDGRYRLVDHVGTGRVGAVWSAVDLRLRRAVAVRLVAGDDAERTSALAATASGWVPGMTRVFDFGADQGIDGSDGTVTYLVREFVPGCSFDDRVDADGVRPATAAAIGAGVATTLAGLHLLGVAHGAVHGANIVLAADGAPGDAALTDFGLGAVRGAPTPRAADDVRGLGEALLGAVTGRRVVGSRTIDSALRRLPRDGALRPRERQAWLEVLRPMTAEDPLLRPGAAAVAAALSVLARDTADLESRARPRGRADEPPPWEAVFTI